MAERHLDVTKLSTEEIEKRINSHLSTEEGKDYLLTTFNDLDNKKCYVYDSCKVSCTKMKKRITI